MLQVKGNHIVYLIQDHHCCQTDVLSQIYGIERMENNLDILL